MSMNLTLNDSQDGPSIDLWQTPTWVTWTCLSVDPVTGEPDGGHKAVRRRYSHWVRSHSNGKWDNPSDLEWEIERIQEHLEKVFAVSNPYFSVIYNEKGIHSTAS